MLLSAALNTGFCGMKQLGVLLFHPGWDNSPSQDTHPEWNEHASSLQEYPHSCYPGAGFTKLS